MFYFTRTALVAVMAAGMAVPALAADLYEPQVVEAPPPVVQDVQYGGWYIRGDLGYRWSQWRGADYITYGPGTNVFSSGKLRGGLSLGGGVGYQVNRYFRTDVTGDYWFKSDFRGGTVGSAGVGCVPGVPCTSTEVSKMSAFLLLANAYVDIGTWHGVTPYVGAGIGGAHVKWDKVYDPNTTEQNPGSSNWRFAYALMAGASYCLTEHTKLDVGYRFSHITGGRMFEYDASSAGPGFDKGFNNHEVRAGLRYSFGGASSCAEPEVVTYEPEPIYTK